MHSPRTPVLDSDWKRWLRTKARELGFLSCGVAPAEDLSADAQAHFSEWLERRYHDRMEYLARDPEIRFRPGALLPGAQSVVCVTATYAARAARDGESPLPPGTGRVARYARGQDYHRVLDPPLRGLESWIVENGGPGTRTRRFCDAGPLMERPFAQRAGLGFVGRHTLLITPEAGSWVLLAAIITSLPIPPDAPGTGTCGQCTRCLDACPTHAFPAPGVLDARRCISNLTIERHGEFTEADSRRLGEWVFGCDVCQEVCPYNKEGADASFDNLNETRFPAGEMRLADLLEVRSNREFERRYGDSPLNRPRLNNMRRNAAAVAENRGDKPLARQLRAKK